MPLKDDLKEGLLRELKANDKWCVISAPWARRLSSNLNGDGKRPGPIDNASLLVEGKSDVLRKDIVVDDEYCLLPESLYDRLAEKYSGGPKILRTVVVHGVRQEASVDLHPIHLKVMRATQTKPCGASAIDFYASRFTSLKRLKLSVCAKYQCPPHKARLWLVTNDDGVEYQLLPEATKGVQTSLMDLALESEHTLMVETMTGEGMWPRDLAQSSSAQFSGTMLSWVTQSLGVASREAGPVRPQGYASYTRTWGNDLGTPAERGAVGLRNLGNTCFMNSALQCLSHTEVLTCYFADNGHLAELNTKNVLGMQGQCAVHYGELMADMWSDKFTYCAPSRLKSIVGQFAPQFSGYQQQDAQELLAFLLDGLHEDLNRVPDPKPYVEAVEDKGRPDEEVAQEAWDKYLMRNKSVIVDYFQGQFKSKVSCPTKGCGNVSVTFDPCLFLSLPIPFEESTVVEMGVVPADPREVALKYAIKVPKYGSVQHVVHALMALREYSDEESLPIALFDIYSYRVYSRLQEHRALPRSNGGTFMLAYELDAEPSPTRTRSSRRPPPIDDEEDRIVAFQIVHRRLEKDYYTRKKTRPVLFGTPLVRTAPESALTNRYVLLDTIKNIHARYFTRHSDAPTIESFLDPRTRPFEVVLTNATGRECLMCSYTSHCTGCVLPDSHEEFTATMAKACVAVQWKEEAMKELRFEGGLPVCDHESMRDDGPSTSSKRMDLAKCFTQFSNPERLGADDEWYCGKCKEHVRAEKQMGVWMLPEVLVIHLKRFYFGGRYRQKLDVLVDYPIDGLDMSPWVLGPTDGDGLIYDLYAVSVHMGGTHGGHYIAYAKNFVSGKWYNFDDSRVTPIRDVASVRTKNAYILFYRRRKPEHHVNAR